ncbi:MAG: major capsid protein [Microviridae sp.]|nr:MAG: major capsid protein [Microviridae sp.]
MAEKYFKQPEKAQQHFANVPTADIERSRFDRSHGRKTTFDAGELIPVYVDEVLPGDSFQMKTTAFCRLATPLKPLMDNMQVDIHYFFVPYRLVWFNWERFMGERTNPDDTIDQYRIPTTTIKLKTLDTWHLAHQLGLPMRKTNVAATDCPVTVSALPFRAYVLIFNDWYREQNTQAWQPFSLGDGPDAWDGYAVLRRNKRHDYFTSCLPWPQKGEPVYVPLGVDAPILPSGTDPSLVSVNNTTPLKIQATTSGVSSAATFSPLPGGAHVVEPLHWSQTGMIADLTAATAMTINDLRTAFQIQRLLERDARSGTRYVEVLLGHFGVVSPDARLQRPEYLGGGTGNISINPIAQTVSDADAPLANLAAYGTGVGNGGFSKSFTEHGVVIGCLSVRSDKSYQQGIERFWSRQTRYDFYWPALAHLGEQAVLNKEIFYRSSAMDNDVFGYQERYAEYRYKPSTIAGVFHSEYPESLDMWHLAQDFVQVPPLNWGFFLEFTPLDRCIAVPSEPHFLCDLWFDLKCERPMPIYSVPGMIDHF